MNGDNQPQGLMVRLSKMYKLPNQTLAEFNAEVKKLTEKDRDDFRKWFNEAGLPTT